VPAADHRMTLTPKSHPAFTRDFKELSHKQRCRLPLWNVRFIDQIYGLPPFVQAVQAHPARILPANILHRLRTHASDSYTDSSPHVEGCIQSLAPIAEAASTFCVLGNLSGDGQPQRVASSVQHESREVRRLRALLSLFPDAACAACVALRLLADPHFSGLGFSALLCERRPGRFR